MFFLHFHSTKQWAMWRSAEHKEIKLFVHLDSFLQSFKQLCTLRVENQNGIHLKQQNSKSWVALWEKYVETGKKARDCIHWKRKQQNSLRTWSLFHCLEKENKSKITADVVGHVPKEISRTVFFLISRGGKVVGVCWMKSATPRPFQKEDLKFYWWSSSK